MKRKISFIIFCVFLINITCVGFAQAKDNGKNKNFFPPGLAHKYQKGQVLPPPFQNVNDSEVLEGKIVYKVKISNKYWIVVMTNDLIKTFCLENFQELAIGDLVQIEYTRDKIINIELLDENDNQEEGDLNYFLTVNPLNSSIGQKIRFSLKIQNNNEFTVERELYNEKVYDFIVKRNGVKVWQWSNGKNFDNDDQTIKIEQGEFLTYSETWKPENKGFYTIEAYFMGESTTQPVKEKNFYVSEQVIKDFNPVLNLNIVKDDGDELLVLKVKNNLNSTVNYNFVEPLYDFWIKKNDEEIWKLSEEQNYSTEVQSIKFLPTEEKFYYTTYDFSEDETYKVYASFNSGNIIRVVGPITINN